MSYHYEGKNRFFEANRSIAEFEHRPGVTVTFTSQVDLTQVQRIRQAAPTSQKPSYTAFVVKALALAMKEFPYANRRVCRRYWWLPFFGGKCLQAFDSYDVAVAVERDLPGIEYMTFADIVRDADQQSLEEINNWLRALSKSDIDNNKQWRDFYTAISRLPRWLSTILIRLPVFVPGMWVKYRGAAAMISSPAKYGVDLIVTSWTSPLGISFGYVKQRPVVKDGEIVACPTFNLVMNFDRRVMLGAQAARFFKRFLDLLENAETELVDHLP